LVIREKFYTLGGLHFFSDISVRSCTEPGSVIAIAPSGIAG
jgi:hypothetical protein